MKPKKVPQRLCLGCNEMKPKPALMRIVKSPEGEISLDFTGKKPGRGAYLCRNADCLAKAMKTHRLEKAFSCRVEGAVYEAMQQSLAAALQSSDDLPEGG